jgi:hypothetical protein
MSFHRNVNEHEVRRFLLTAILFIGTVIAGFFAVRLNHPLLMIAIPLVPLVAWLIGEPSALLLTLFLVNYSSISLPGLPGGLTLVNFFQAIMIGWALINGALNKNRFFTLTKEKGVILLFFVHSLLIIAVRGFGMSIGRGQTFGGGAYVYLFLSIFFYLAASQIPLKEKHIRILFWGGIVLSLIPLLVQLSIYFSGGATYYLTRFFSVNTSSVVDAVMSGEEDVGSVRFSAVSGLRTVLLMVALVVPAVRRRKVLSWGLVGAAVLMTLTSGFRSSLVGVGALVFMWLLYESNNRWRTFFMLAGLGLIGWLIALAVIPVLPDTFQRTLSFLPLAREWVDPRVLMDAQNSVDFRLGIWELAWRRVPEYLLIGRGMTVEISQWAWLQSSSYRNPEFFFATHNYHSGPLSLLVDFGLPGFILFTSFLIMVCVKAWKGVNQSCAGRNDLISRFYAFLTIQVTYKVVAFYLIYGDIKKAIPGLLLDVVLLMAVRRELERQAEESRRISLSEVSA